MPGAFPRPHCSPNVRDNRIRKAKNTMRNHIRTTLFLWLDPFVILFGIGFGVGKTGACARPGPVTLILFRGRMDLVWAAPSVPTPQQSPLDQTSCVLSSRSAGSGVRRRSALQSRLDSRQLILTCYGARCASAPVQIPLPLSPFKAVSIRVNLLPPSPTKALGFGGPTRW